MKVESRVGYSRFHENFSPKFDLRKKPKVNPYTESVAVIKPSILFGRTEMRNSYIKVFFQLMITEISF
jgi:hypothetical protein